MNSSTRLSDRGCLLVATLMLLALALSSHVVAKPVGAATPATLAERIRGDLDAGRDIVVTSYVALWSEHSLDPDRNLYWGALYGHEAMFRPSRQDEIGDRLAFLQVKRYTTIADSTRALDPRAVKVFAAPIPGRETASGQGSRLVIVTLAYHDMEQAALDMGIQLKTGRLPAWASDEPEIRDMLRKSYVMGYWGHNIYYGGSGVDCLENVPSTRTDGPRGLFFVGCQSAKWYPGKFRSPAVEPLLFTTTNMAPEGYVGLALYDGIARSLSKEQVRRNVAEAYRVYQRLQRAPLALFVNDWQEIERYAVELPSGSCSRELADRPGR